MGKNFEVEKIKINIRVRKLFRVPLNELLTMAVEISQETLEKCLEIFMEAAGEHQQLSAKSVGNLHSIFPAMLWALDGNFSKEAIEYLANFVCNEAVNRQVNVGKRVSIYDDPGEDV